ncbi:uncharacterized protein PAC_13777 [Phialocephala subalpina]|uniref:Uncharacterized protein n=1 Tax=Phialocephala subalpina TaxID=576137 RepID=A0A1L7XFR0_9HELO|nr:uncharacterized protein PAC_13777 [Phialocephala subalpina]
MNPRLPPIIAVNNSVENAVTMPEYELRLDHPESNQHYFRVGFASGIAPPPNTPESQMSTIEIDDDLPPLSLDSLKIQVDKKVQDDDNKRVMVVGISGCTSSGKSLLAMILAKVFDKGKPHTFRMFHALWVIWESSTYIFVFFSLHGCVSWLRENVCPYLSASVLAEHVHSFPPQPDTGFCTSFNVPHLPGVYFSSNWATYAKSRLAIVMHQDTYFQPKCICPLERFRASENDLPFMLKSLSNDNAGHYVIMTDGIDPSAREPLVTSSDADCDEAIDFITMLGMITTVINTGELPNDVPSPGPPHLILGLDDSYPITQYHDLAPYATLIAELREVVAKNVTAHALENIKENRVGKYIQAPASGNSTPISEGAIDIKSNDSEDWVDIKINPRINTLLPTIFFVEGFLLFSDPNGPAHDLEKMHIYTNLPSHYDLEWNQNAIREKFQSIADLTHELHHTSPQDPFSIKCQEEYEQEIWGKNIEAKYEMQGKFDMKMWLPTSKEEAFKRRFERDAYVDYPKGERHPGQMWKSEGYFDGIAWKHFEQEHAWLRDEGEKDLSKGGDAECTFKPGIFKGVYVRPKMDASVEETVRWAVEVVLHQVCSAE